MNIQVDIIEEFEHFLSTMNISIKKKQISMHREDVTPHYVVFN